MAALAGGIWGGASALILGGVRVVLGDLPSLPDVVVGHVAFVAVYLFPFVLALVAVRWRQPAHQAAAWAASATLALLASFTAFSGVTLILLPAALLLGVGAARAHVAAGLRQTPAIIGVSLGLIALGVAAWFALIVLDDGACWELVRTADGAESWHSLPFSHTGPQLEGTIRGICATNVTSPVEAGLSLGLLSVAGIGLRVVLPRWRGRA